MRLCVERGMVVFAAHFTSPYVRPGYAGQGGVLRLFVQRPYSTMPLSVSVALFTNACDTLLASK